jgi:hypothetical protein
MRLSRPGIGLSLLCHALALYGLVHWAWHAPRPAPLQAAIVWFDPQGLALARPPPQERATDEPTIGPADTSHAEDSPRRSERPGRRKPARPAPAPAPTPPRAAAPSTAPVQDLVEARRRAAVDVVHGTARADAHRSFEFPGTIAQQRAFDESERVRRRERGLGPPLTVFDSPAKGRAGLAEEPTGPFSVHWVSDDCYVFREPLDRFVLPPSLFVEPTTCTRRFARTDLFVTAKPTYLMGAEERKAVDAETQRREVLRRPTTGAVMSPTKD